MSGTYKAQPFDASALVDIYLDGLSTGAATTAMLYNGGNAPDADRVADMIASKVVADPAAMEMVRKEILERLQGIDNSPYTFTVHAGAAS